MIKAGKGVLQILLMAISGAAAMFAWQSYTGQQPAVASEVASSHTASDTLHLSPDSPQLSFLKIETIHAFPEPLAEPLNARIAYDDNHTARIFSPVAGRVVKIAAEVGERVKAGDPLLWIDSPDFAQAASDSMKGDADLLRKKEAYERAKLLYEAQGMARKDLESAEADWLQADAEAKRANARMKNLNASADGKVEDRFVLRASISGIVSERKVNAGSEVRTDSNDPLFVVSDMRHLWVLIDLPEQQLGKVRKGMPVSIEVDAFPAETFKGRITALGGALDPVTRRVQVRCEVDNAQSKLLPEMFARVTPIVGKGSGLPRVPNTSLFIQGLYNYLFVEQSPGVLQRRRVTPAMQGPDFTYIKEGLRSGERVVTSGALLLNSELSSNE
jgi:membrane fusion protein, heavy metal efflux system